MTSHIRQPQNTLYSLHSRELSYLQILYEYIIATIKHFGLPQLTSQQFAFFPTIGFIVPFSIVLHTSRKDTMQQQLDSWNYNHLLFFCLRFIGSRHYILFIKYIGIYHIYIYIHIYIYVVLTIIIYSLMHDRAIFQLKHPSMHKSQREIQVVSKSTSSSRVLFL